MFEHDLAVMGMDTSCIGTSAPARLQSQKKIHLVLNPNKMKCSGVGYGNC